ETFRSNDNGEPSGTAGKPILGQINSHELTDVIILVVRYFGGVKLGTSGLIVAYKTAAAEAIANAQVVTRTVDEEYSFSFEYPQMNNVLKVARDMGANIVSQSYGNDCRMTLSIRRGKMEQLKERVEKALSPF
ncbi:MAG: YigZ family protein, partial [Bacteroidaceae bacterium]|nr:YigZ family protein [Bacteroidaceae bacterium]